MKNCWSFTTIIFRTFLLLITLDLVPGIRAQLQVSDDKISKCLNANFTGVRDLGKIGNAEVILIGDTNHSDTVQSLHRQELIKDLMIKFPREHNILFIEGLSRNMFVPAEKFKNFPDLKELQNLNLNVHGWDNRELNLLTIKNYKKQLEIIEEIRLLEENHNNFLQDCERSKKSDGEIAEFGEITSKSCDLLNLKLETCLEVDEDLREQRNLHLVDSITQCRNELRDITPSLSAYQWVKSFFVGSKDNQRENQNQDIVLRIFLIAGNLHFNEQVLNELQTRNIPYVLLHSAKKIETREEQIKSAKLYLQELTKNL